MSLQENRERLYMIGLDIPPSVTLEERTREVYRARANLFNWLIETGQDNLLREQTDGDGKPRKIGPLGIIFVRSSVDLRQKLQDAPGITGVIEDKKVELPIFF